MKWVPGVQEFGGIRTAFTLGREVEVRHSTLDKGHEEGGLAYANAGSSLRSPPGLQNLNSPDPGSNAGPYSESAKC